MKLIKTMGLKALAVTIAIAALAFAIPTAPQVAKMAPQETGQLAIADTPLDVAQANHLDGLALMKATPEQLEALDAIAANEHARVAEAGAATITTTTLAAQEHAVPVDQVAVAYTATTITDAFALNKDDTVAQPGTA